MDPKTLIKKDNSKHGGGNVFFNDKFEDYYNDKLSDIMNNEHKMSRTPSKHSSFVSFSSTKSFTKGNIDQLYLLERKTDEEYDNKILEYYLNSEKDLEVLDDPDNDLIPQIHDQLIHRDISDYYFLELEDKYSLRSIKNKYISEYSNQPPNLYLWTFLYYLRYIKRDKF